MSLNYYAEFEDDLSLADVTRIGASAFAPIDDRNVRHAQTGLIIHLEKNEVDDWHIETTEKVFEFTPKVYVSLYFNKRDIEGCETVMIDLVLKILRGFTGDCILGFSESDCPFLQRKTGHVLIDTRWPDIISAQSFEAIKNSGLPSSITTLPDF